MVLKLRLARVKGPGGSKRHHAVYNLVLAHARTARDSLPLEVLGTYSPYPKEVPGAEPGAKKQKHIQLDVSRIKYWLGTGAQPSDTVWRLLSMIGLLEPRYLPTGPQSLKAVRFPTHEKTYAPASSLTTPQTSMTQSIREKRLKADGKLSGAAFASSTMTPAAATAGTPGFGSARAFATARPGVRI